MKNRCQTVIGITLTVLMAQAVCFVPGFAATTSDDNPVLIEIVVTAQKRSENLQDVPIAITAISSSSLKNVGIETTADLQVAVPSLVYNTTAGFAQPYMRGVGSDLLQPNSDPSVATYVDGAFVAFNQSTIQNLLGVQQIEVLAGPQGTLYGRNSVGGAINVSTLTPTHETEAEGSVSTGNYARKEGSFHISGGASDTLAIGIYLGGSIRNRYVTELTYRPVNDPYSQSHENEYGARIKAVFTPTDWLKLTGSIEKTHVGSFELAALRSISPNSLGYVLFPNIPRVIENYVVQTAYPDHNIVDQKSGTLREELNFSQARILGISNYRNTDVNGANDDVTTGSPIYTDLAPDEKSQQYSQELQLLSNPESKIQWIVGTYFFHEWGGFFPQVSASSILFPPPLYSVSSVARVVTRSVAEFAQTTIPLEFIAEGLRITLGGRFTDEQKRFADVQSFLNISNNPVLPNAIYPERSHKWNRFTPKATVDYKINKTLLYATFSEGFKSGSYNLTAPSQVNPVNPEQLKAFEVGLKAQMWNNRINWNNAAYSYDWKDLQVQVISTATGGATSLQNAASARAYGLESSVTAALTTDLTANAGIALEHTRYQSFPDYSGVNPETLAPVIFDAKGNQLQRAPKVVATAGGEYHHQMAFGGALHASVNFYYNSGYYWTPQNTYKQDAYELINGTLGFDPNDHWSVTTWVRNLTNTHYFSTILPIAGLGTLAQDANPRMYGISVGYKF